MHNRCQFFTYTSTLHRVLVCLFHGMAVMSMKWFTICSLCSSPMRLSRVCTRILYAAKYSLKRLEHQTTRNTDAWWLRPSLNFLTHNILCGESYALMDGGQRLRLSKRPPTMAFPSRSRTVGEGKDFQNVEDDHPWIKETDWFIMGLDRSLGMLGIHHCWSGDDILECGRGRAAVTCISNAGSVVS